MKIPLYVAVAQWALLLALGLLVVVMYRQLGRVFNRSESTERAGPPVGSKPGSFEYRRVSDGRIRLVRPGDGRGTLLAFVDPTCPSCEQLVGALDKLEDSGELEELRVLLLLVSDPPSYLEMSEAFLATRLEIGEIIARATVEEYRPSATPLLVAMDRLGTVRSVGPVVRASDVRAFSQACLLSGSEGELKPVTFVPRGAEEGGTEAGKRVFASELKGEGDAGHGVDRFWNRD